SLISGESMRVKAISPWSEYQTRLREKAEEELLANEEFSSLSHNHKGPIPASEGALKPFPDSMMKSLQRQIEDTDVPSYSTGSVNNKLMQTQKKPRPPSPQSVIRPQLRTRRPDDPRNFMSKKTKVPKEVDPPHYNPPFSKPPFAMVDARPHHLPAGAINAIERQGTPLAPLTSSAARQPADLQPLQFGSNTLTSPLANAENPLTSLSRTPFTTSNVAPAYSRLGPAPGLILSNGGQSNIVNSIFSQSQARGVVSEIPMGGIPHGIPTLPQPPQIIQPPQLPTNFLSAGLPPSPPLPNLFEGLAPTHGFSGADNG
ncbi:hypothetical protein PMAYCL1PPCAC_30707, partial [Pristionchus mayeri]